MKKYSKQTFTLTEDQVKKISKFHPKCQKKYMGAIGGGTSYIFSPTSLGPIIEFECNCKKKLDLTDYDVW